MEKKLHLVEEHMSISFLTNKFNKIHHMNYIPLYLFRNRILGGPREVRHSGYCYFGVTVFNRLLMLGEQKATQIFRKWHRIRVGFFLSF